MDEIRAHLKAFRTTDWLILIAVALPIGLLANGGRIAFLLLMGLFPYPFVRAITSSVDALLALVAGV